MSKKKNSKVMIDKKQATLASFVFQKKLYIVKKL